MPTARLELAQPKPLPPQDSVSTNFTTSAIYYYLYLDFSLFLTAKAKNLPTTPYYLGTEPSLAGAVSLTGSTAGFSAGAVTVGDAKTPAPCDLCAPI